jgi:hypothetical protein
MEAEELVAVQNTSNVWCVSALIRGKLALVTLVQTENGSVKTEPNKTKGKKPAIVTCVVMRQPNKSMDVRQK